MFKERFLELVKYNNISSFQKISDDTGIAVSTISHWLHENKKPSFETLIMLADYFQTTIDYLACRDKEFDANPGTQALSYLEQEIMTKVKKCGINEQMQINAYIQGLTAKKEK